MRVSEIQVDGRGCETVMAEDLCWMAVREITF